MAADRPLILITNDDGVRAAGIGALAAALDAVGDVIVSAPSGQQSGVGHGITLGEPLRVRKVRPGFYGVSGRPADAVFIGFAELCERTPDLVVSGINHGANLGSDVFYSGTVAGAIEGALRGVPSFAVSLALPPTWVDHADESEAAQKTGVAPAFEGLPDHLLPEQLEAGLKQAARFASGVARMLLHRPVLRGVVLNINTPAQPAHEFRWTRIGRRFYNTDAIRRIDPRGLPYYWIGGSHVDPHDDADDADSRAVAAGLISVTPLSLDWTARVRSPGWEIEGFSESGPESS